jgi:hypothetical protein
MKKWMRGIKSKLVETTERWLYREEYAEAERKQAEFTAELREKIGPLIEFLKEVVDEDLEVKPTEDDIERYYWLYSRAMVSQRDSLKAKNVWCPDVDILSESEYKAQAKEGSWTFLRTSVHLPVCPIDKPRPGHWHTTGISPYVVPPTKPYMVPTEKKDGWDS